MHYFYLSLLLLLSLLYLFERVYCKIENKRLKKKKKNLVGESVAAPHSARQQQFLLYTDCYYYFFYCMSHFQRVRHCFITETRSNQTSGSGVLPSPRCFRPEIQRKPFSKDHPPKSRENSSLGKEVILCLVVFSVRHPPPPKKKKREREKKPKKLRFRKWRKRVPG